jgi:hypothetical protein
MKNAAIFAILALTIIASGCSGHTQENTTFNDINLEDEKTYQITTEEGTVQVTGDIYSQKNGTLKAYFWPGKQNFSYNHSNDTWIDQSTGSVVVYNNLLEEVKNVTANQSEDFEFKMNSANAGSLAYPPNEQNYTLHLVVDKGGTDIEFKQIHFEVIRK